MQRQRHKNVKQSGQDHITLEDLEKDLLNLKSVS